MNVNLRDYSINLLSEYIANKAVFSQIFKTANFELLSYLKGHCGIV